MNNRAWRNAIEYLREKILEYYEKILDENIEWKDKEQYYVKMLENKLILKKLLGEVGEKVVIKTRVEW